MDEGKCTEAARMIAEGYEILISEAKGRDSQYFLYRHMHLNLTNALPCNLGPEPDSPNRRMGEIIHHEGKIVTDRVKARLKPYRTA
jgi:hypothetical protein